MEKSNYNRGGGGGCGSGGVRCGNKQYHQGQYQTGGGARNSCGGGDNNCQPHNQGQYQSCGYGRRGGRGGDRSGTQMRTNSPPAQPWGDRPVHGGQGGTQMGTNPPPAQPWGYRSGQGGIQRPQSAMGQGARATGGRRSWSGSPRHVGGRGSWASAEGGGAGAGQTWRRILYLFMFLFLFLSFIKHYLSLLFLRRKTDTILVSFSRIKEGMCITISLRGRFWTQKLFTYLSMISAIMKILEQASRHTTMFITMSIISHLISCRSSYTSCASPLLDALSLSPLSHQFAILPVLPIGDGWRCSLLLQLRHRLLSHHHHLHMRLHLTISSTSFTRSSKT